MSVWASGWKGERWYYLCSKSQGNTTFESLFQTLSQVPGMRYSLPECNAILFFTTDIWIAWGFSACPPGADHSRLKNSIHHLRSSDIPRGPIGNKVMEVTNKQLLAGCFYYETNMYCFLGCLETAPDVHMIWVNKSHAAQKFFMVNQITSLSCILHPIQRAATGIWTPDTWVRERARWLMNH